jgi:hypothetical protein
LSTGAVGARPVVNRGEIPMKLNLSVKSAGRKARVFVTPGMFYNK